MISPQCYSGTVDRIAAILTPTAFNLLNSMSEAGQNTVIIPVDGSEHCKNAFDCKSENPLLNDIPALKSGGV